MGDYNGQDLGSRSRRALPARSAGRARCLLTCRSIPIYRRMCNGCLRGNEFYRFSQASNEPFKEGLSKLSKWQTKHFGIPNCIDASHCFLKYRCQLGSKYFPAPHRLPAPLKSEGPGVNPLCSAPSPKIASHPSCNTSTRLGPGSVQLPPHSRSLLALLTIIICLI